MKENIVKNAVVQVNENGPEGWIGCFVQVSEVKSWGVQGWVQVPKSGSAYIRLPFEQIDLIGHAVMVQPENT